MSGSNFQKKSYGTWTHPGTNHIYAIDHCLISTDSKRCLVDAGVNLFADCWSDHFLTSMDIKFSSVAIRKIFKKTKPKSDYQALRTSPELRLDIGGKVDALIKVIQDSGEIVSFSACMDILSSVCKEIITPLPKKINQRVIGMTFMTKS